MKKVFLIGLISLIWLIGRPVLAADIPGLEVANTFKIVDSAVVDGDILITGVDGLTRAKLAYDNNLFGVYSATPAIVFRTSEVGDRPVVRTGVAMVNMVGPVGIGDYVTSSPNPGKGQKADRSGYVLGKALDGLASGDGKIRVALQIQYAEITTARSANRLLEYLGASLFSNAKDPEKFGLIIRYILAALVILLTLGFAFRTLSKSIPKGIEAIGRNPLARNSIYFSMGVSVGFVILIMVLGIAVALLILRL